MSEIDLMRRLQVRASQFGARLFRQNVGMAWVGKPQRFFRPSFVRVEAGDVLLRNARPFHVGIPGMSDLGGWTSIEISPDMIGATVAVATQVEVKENGRPTAEQNSWIDAVRKAGGRAGVARSEADLIAILGGK